METRTAPTWIRDKERRYRRTRWMWICASGLGWLGFFGALSLAFLHTPAGALKYVLYCLCLAAWVGLDLLKPASRASRFETAACGLAGAIVRYEVDPELPESVLSEAAQRAQESLHIKRVRIAPAWIRRNKLRYRLTALAWASPVILTLAFFGVSAIFRWRWVRPWQVLVVLAVLFVGAALKTRRLVQARQILDEAIERYEFESAADDEGALAEADQRASATLSGLPSPT
ncbi:MAG: hypothetical protein ABSH00_19770 [Bryobacteraceae bacterium]